jgi:hypothetical protein
MSCRLLSISSNVEGTHVVAWSPDHATVLDRRSPVFVETYGRASGTVRRPATTNLFLETYGRARWHGQETGHNKVVQVARSGDRPQLSVRRTRNRLCLCLCLCLDAYFRYSTSLWSYRQRVEQRFSRDPHLEPASTLAVELSVRSEAPPEREWGPA